MLWIAAFWLLLHWQALSPAAQPTAEAADTMHDTPHDGTAAIADAHELSAEQASAEVRGALGVGALVKADETGPER